LSNGEKKIVDLYLPTTGLIPNSEFIPKTLLNEGGFVKVDEFLHVKGFSDIWAAGDVADVQAPQIVHACKSSPPFLAREYTDANQKKQPSKQLHFPRV
jgi:NADPH-dependent 2,4-dienoyl-CoA reductase/sulfur reductase-like enzyme